MVRGQVFSLDLPQDYQADGDKIPYALIQQAEVEHYAQAQYISEHPALLPVTLLYLVLIDGGHSLGVVANECGHNNALFPDLAAKGKTTAESCPTCEKPHS